MSIYRVLRTSLYRRSGLLRVVVEQSGGNHGGRGSDLEVEGMGGKTVRCRGGRIAWEGDTLTSMRILIIEPPDFPVEELKDKRLLCDS